MFMLFVLVCCVSCGESQRKGDTSQNFSLGTKKELSLPFYFFYVCSKQLHDTRDSILSLFVFGRQTRNPQKSVLSFHCINFDAFRSSSQFHYFSPFFALPVSFFKVISTTVAREMARRANTAAMSQQRGRSQY